MSLKTRIFVSLFLFLLGFISLSNAQCLKTETYSDIDEQLTEKQKIIVRETLKQLKENKSSKETMVAKMDSLLDSWSIATKEIRELSDMQLKSKAMTSLTDEQKKTIDTEIEKMKKDGNSQEEIEKAIEKILSNWAIKKAERPKNAIKKE